MLALMLFPMLAPMLTQMLFPMLSLMLSLMLAQMLFPMLSLMLSLIRYTRKDSVGSIVRSFPKGRMRKPPTIRARCYSPPGSIYPIFTI